MQRDIEEFLDNMQVLEEAPPRMKYINNLYSIDLNNLIGQG